jgi:putative methyltransferase (TIGR04325 family)
MRLKNLIPPALLELWRRGRSRMPTFASYEEAAAHCGSGYGEDELVRVVVDKTECYRDSLKAGRPALSSLREASVATAVGLSAEGGRLNCIDFGGAAGAHFFLAQSLFGRSIELNWSVVETRQMAAAAGRLKADGLRFFSDIAAAASALRSKEKTVDLIFTSCALPYLPDPEGTLRQLTEVGARRIFVTRNPLADSELNRRVAVQTSRLSSNGPGPLPAGYKDRAVAYPVTFCDRTTFEGILSERYALDLTFQEERGAYYLHGRPIQMYGYLGRLNSGKG